MRDAKGELDARGSPAPRRRAAVARGEPDARHARAAGSASSSPASTGCRRRRSSRPRIARKLAGGDPHVEIMIPLIGHRARARAARTTGCARSRPTTFAGREVDERRLPRRHDGRDATRRARRRRDRRGRRVLLVRHQRPHADDLRLLARRRRGPLHVASTSSSSCCRANPFETLDRTASASSCGWRVERGRATRPGIKLGICGEHGGDPASVRVLRRGRARLRVVLAVPRADRPPRGRPRRARSRRAGEHCVAHGSVLGGPGGPTPQVGVTRS